MIAEEGNSAFHSLDVHAVKHRGYASGSLVINLHPFCVHDELLDAASGSLVRECSTALAHKFRIQAQLVQHLGAARDISQYLISC